MNRSIQRIRGAGLAITLTLALGVGSLVAGLGLADAALWRDPPFPAAADLVLLVTTRRTPTEPTRRERWSFPRIQRLRAEIRSVPRVASFTTVSAALAGTELTEPTTGEIVSPEYFGVLGVVPASGRVFGADEDLVPGAHPVVVLSDDLWRRRFDASPDVLGRTVELNRRTLTVIGVMPPGFRGLSDEARFWVPTAMAPVISYDAYLTTDQNFIGVVARLPEGTSLADLRAELQVLGPALARAAPSDDDTPASIVSADAVSLSAGRTSAALRRSVYLLLGAVFVLYLLACANAASLALGQAISLRRDAAVRASLGAGAGVLLRHYFLRTAGIVTLGALAGLPLAWLASRVPVPLDHWGHSNLAGSVAPFADPEFGLRSVLAWLLVTVVTIAIVAPAPAFATVRGDLASALRGGQRGSATGLSVRRPSGRALIVALEASLAVLLLAVGGLMIESFARMRGTPLGVQADHVLTFTLRPGGRDPGTEEAIAFVDRVRAALEAVPGITSVSVDGGAPLSGSASTTLRIAGRPDPGDDAPVVLRHYIAPDHFRTLGIPLVRGRAFTGADRAGAPTVAIISASAARRFFPEEDPIGQRIWFGGSAFTTPDSSAEIVGIVGDVEYRRLDRNRNAASIYTPYRQFTYGWRTWFVRTAGDPATAAGPVSAAVHAVDPDAPIAELQPLRALIAASWSSNRFDAWFFGGFAGLALFMAATGIYAVVSFAVRQRDREIAIRLAIGAPPASVFRMVVREGMVFPCLGLLAGAVATVLTARVLAGMVYGVAPDNPRVAALAVGVLAVVALLACAVPALRAMRVDPQDALRAD